jgi:hypothetical protein
MEDDMIFEPTPAPTAEPEVSAPELTSEPDVLEELEEGMTLETSPDMVVQPMADYYYNYPPQDYYSVIYQACSTAIEERTEVYFLTMEDAMSHVSLYSLGILVCLVLGGVVCFVRSLLQPSSS